MNSVTLALNLTDLNLTEFNRFLAASERRAVMGWLAQSNFDDGNTLSEENRWFKGYFETFSKGYNGFFLHQPLLWHLLLFCSCPLEKDYYLVMKLVSLQKIRLHFFMEDPEFYLWLDKEGMIFAERQDD